MATFFPPSKGESRWRAVSYLFVAGIGFYVMLNPDPSVIENRLGLVSIVWSLFMLTAVPTAITVLLSRYRAESILLPLFGSALMVATVNVWARILNGDGNELVPRACIATALLCLLVVRGLQLHRIVKAKPWITTEH